jgi:agmatinase
MVKLVGVPLDTNSFFLKGPSAAPQFIRLIERIGCTNPFSEDGTNVYKDNIYEDVGDISFEDTNPEKAFYTIKNRTTELISDRNKLIFIGGDHSVTYPIISAYVEKYDNLNVLHLDAHADLRDIIHDNLYSHSSQFARIMETGKINSLTQVGVRTLCSHQREQAKKFCVNIIEMKDFNLNFIEALKSPLYISIDIDVLDPAFAPGVTYCEPGGMTTRQLIEIIQNTNVKIIGADIVEFNPFRDINNMTALVCYKLLKELIAKMI